MKRATQNFLRFFAIIIISIHALVKRATGLVFASYSVKHNFNPRPREEGDPFAKPLFADGLYFNPRPREEGDLCCHSVGVCLYISIHALVKRATLYALVSASFA